MRRGEGPGTCEEGRGKEGPGMCDEGVKGT